MGEAKNWSRRMKEECTGVKRHAILLDTHECELRDRKKCRHVLAWGGCLTSSRAEMHIK